MPAWTLGQQPDAPPSKPETPAKPETPSKPEAPAKPETPATPAGPSQPEQPEPGRQFIKKYVPPITDLSIEDIKAGFALRLKGLEHLGFRYSVARRDRPARMTGGGLQAVNVQVADVVIEPGSSSHYRLDVLSALANADHQEPDGPKPDGPTVPWTRQFDAGDGSGLVTFRSAWSQAGPIPFRRHPVQGQVGDDLAVALLNPNFSPAVNGDRSAEPLEPPPASVLDLAGATVLLLLGPDSLDLAGATALLLLGPDSVRPAQLDLAGADVVDGREVVRVAWVGNRNDNNQGGGLRGLLWVAPALGFAVVRSEATQDPSQVGMPHGRRTWRKTAGDFVEVGGLWLPRKVEIRFTEAGRLPAVEYELAAVIEDYRANPEVTPETFHPKFKIEALDERTGDFTTVPPAPAPGLVNRLARAVRESKFGPPVAENIAEEPSSAPKQKQAVKDGSAMTPMIPPSRARTMRPELGVKNNPTPPPAGPGPAAAGQVGRPIQSRFVERLEIRRDRQAAEVQKAEAQRDIARATVDRNQALAKKNPQAVSREEITRAEGELKAAEAEVASKKAELDQAGLTLFQVRRGLPENKAAEAQKAEAQLERARAVVARNQAFLKQPNASVSREEIARAEAELKVAEAEIEARRLDQAEAELMRNPTRLSPAPVGDAQIDQTIERRFLADPEVVALAKEMLAAKNKLDDVQRVAAKSGDPAERIAQRKLEALQARYEQLWETKSRAFHEAEAARAHPGPDDVALLEIRRAGKAAEVQKALAQRDLAQAVVNRNKALNKINKSYVSNEENLKAEAELNIAEAEVASKKTELDEADLLLNRARRGPGPIAADRSTSRRSPPTSATPSS